jgi:hypothetical protein
MFGLFDWLKVGAGVLLGAAVAYQVGHWRGDSHGRAAEGGRQDARPSSHRERSRDNEEISRMDMARLCAELDGRWVPDENRCD